MHEIKIIDSGVSNLYNFIKAVEFLGFNYEIVKSKFHINGNEKLILPGVGNFGEFTANIKKYDIENSILESVKKKIPILGICVGMQYLMHSSEESNSSKGLNLFDNKKVYKFKSNNANIKVPLVGNQKLIINRIFKEDKIFNNINDNSRFYFFNSYYSNVDSKYELAKTNHADNVFSSIVKKDNIYGFQFHPEKSRKDGLTLISNFLNL